MDTNEKKPAKTAAKKKTAKKSAVKKTAPKKSAVKKTTAKKTTAKKKSAAKKTTTKKPMKKTTATKKTTAKKTTKKKTTKKTAKKAPAKAKKSPPVKVPEFDSTVMEDLSEELASRVAEDNPILDVESKKFEVGFEGLSHMPESAKSFPPMPRELADLFVETNVTLMVRDPEWIFVYWEIDDATRERFLIPRSAHIGTLMLRWYDVTDLAEFDGSNAHQVMDAEVNDDVASWYQHVPEPNRCWCAELGVLGAEKQFLAICRSNVVRTPRRGLAEAHGIERWMRVAPAEYHRMIFEAPYGVRPQSDWATAEGDPSHPSRTVDGEEIRTVGGQGLPDDGVSLAHEMTVERLAELLSSEYMISSEYQAPSSFTFPSELSRPSKPPEEER